MTGCEILTVAQSAEADRLAVAAGIPSLTLMENAGRAVADAGHAIHPASAVLVLCGPGNNGGDGFCAARHLKLCVYDGLVAALVSVERLKGYAAEMAKNWGGPLSQCTPQILDGA